MRFLIDENLPTAAGNIFTARGFLVEHVADLSELRGKPDEVIFDYAVREKSVIVTRDLGFTNPGRFNLSLVKGIVVLRFPNEITVAYMCEEIKRLITDLDEQHFTRLVVIEPGSIRIREL